MDCRLFETEHCYLEGEGCFGKKHCVLMPLGFLFVRDQWYCVQVLDVVESTGVAVRSGGMTVPNEGIENDCRIKIITDDMTNAMARQ